MSNRFNRLWRKGVVYLAMVAMGGWAFGGLVPPLAMAAPAPVDLSSVKVIPDANPNPVAASVPYAVYMNYTAAPATGGQIQLTFPSAFSISNESPVEVTYGPIGTNSTGGSGSLSGSTLTPNSTSPNTAQLTLGTIPASVTGAVYGFTVMLNNVQNPKSAGSYPGSDFTVQDPADSSTSVSSKTAVVVSPGTGTKIAMSAPSTLSNSILEPDTVTGPFTVTLEDAYGNPTPATSAMRVSLAGSSGTTFYTAPTGSNSSQVTSVTIPQGQDSVQLWVQSTTLGPDMLSATASSGAFVSNLNLTVGHTPQLSFSPTSMVVKGSVPVRQWIPFYVSLPASNVVGETVTLNTTDSNASLYDTAASNSPVTSVYVAAGATVPMYFQDPAPYDYGQNALISAQDASGTTASRLTLGITPASAVQIVITANTFDVTAGKPVQYTLRLLDQYGNPSVAPSTGVTIALSATTEWGGSASGTGVAFSVGKTPVTSVTIPGGKSTVTVDVTGTIAGGYEIDAIASGYSSGSFFGNYPLTVNPASASQLALISDPTGTYIYDGYIMTPVALSLEDQYGNPTDSGQTEVALSSSTSGGEFFIDSNNNYETCVDPSGQISQVSLGSSSDNGSTAYLWYAQPISATSSATLTASAAGLTTQTTTLPELFVSTSGSSTGTGTYSAPYSSIADALAAAPTGATIIVEPGTYNGTVNITNAVNLIANGSVTINASGKANGVVISGENSDGSLVYGFTIENAGNAGVDLTSSTFGDEVADNTFSNDYFGIYNAMSDGGYLDYWANISNSSVTIPYYSPRDPEAVPPSEALTVKLQPGWNTLSLPYVLSSTSLATLENVLANAQSSFAYQNGSWVQVTTSNEASILNTAMAGLYIDIPQSAGVQTITLTPTLAQMPPPTIALQDGWNLVGPSSSFSYSESDTGFLSAASGLPSSDLAMISNPNDGGIAAIPNPLGGTTEVIDVSDGLAYWVYAQNLPSTGATLVGEIPTGNAGSPQFIDIP